MNRCLEMASISTNLVKTNPNVGAILVYNDKIIGSGFYAQYGGPHAEVRAIQSVSQENRQFVKDSTLYVTLEPCNIHGKTPPCTDAIIKAGIRKLVVATSDPNPSMQGHSYSLLEKNGIEIIYDILKKEGNDLIKPFTKQLTHRPFVTIKFAQSSDGYFGKRNKQVWISDPETKRIVHRWRKDHDAILVGYNTANVDNPKLTDRYNGGPNPTRIIIDNDLSLPREHHVWSDKNPTIFVTNSLEENLRANKKAIAIPQSEQRWDSIFARLYDLGLYRILIEGGAETIKSLVKSEHWDEARIIKNNNALNSGIRAPLIVGRKYKSIKLLNDNIDFIYKD